MGKSPTTNGLGFGGTYPPTWFGPSLWISRVGYTRVGPEGPGTDAIEESLIALADAHAEAVDQFAAVHGGRDQKAQAD
jgi:hypothetical protein